MTDCVCFPCFIPHLILIILYILIDKFNYLMNTPSNWLADDERPSIDVCFGPGDNLPRVGRVQQMHEIWKCISSFQGSGSTSKSSLHYIHGSPGMGKTFMFRQLMKFNKNDIPEAIQGFANSVIFYVVDFNRSCCNEINKDLVKKLIYNDFIPLARMFYVEFAEQSELDWSLFINIRTGSILHQGIGNDRAND